MTLSTPAKRTSDRAPASEDRQLASRQVAVFLATTFGLLAGSTVVALGLDVDVSRIQEAPAAGQAALYLQALWPLVGAVVAQLVTRRTLRGTGWGFSRTPWRTLRTAWLYAAGVSLLGPVVVWTTGLAGFDGTDAPLHTLLALTVLTLPYVVLALGEDVGWRGVLVPRLAELGGPRLVVLGGGLAWAAFHWPLILLLGGTPDGVSPVWAVCMFTVGITGLGAVLAWMRLAWGQWPGVLAHAVVNAVAYHLVAPATVDREHTGWFATETGLVGAVVLALSALVWLRAAPLRRVDGRTVALPLSPRIDGAAAGSSVRP
ncbi:MAG TPA: CPBP family intramembrane glutamic endopeptidase [Nocardioidaceae bacterium]|nr:CPBP family intramembrane glutamic endopeptidase [Nocardioidaceae bacterium]